MASPYRRNVRPGDEDLNQDPSQQPDQPDQLDQLDTGAPPSPPPQFSATRGYQSGYAGGFDNTSDPLKMDQQNRMAAKGMGDAINQSTIDAQNEYGQRDARAAGQLDTDITKLEETPGYTSDEAGQINADYTRYRTPQSELDKQYLTDQEQSDIKGDPSKAFDFYDPHQLQGMADETGQSEIASAQHEQQGLDAAVNEGKGAASHALDQESAGMQSAFGDQKSGLEEAVDRGKLGLSGEFSGRQLTDRDVQDIEDQAGRTVGNRYRSAQDDLARRAAAQGNSSPAAMAAAREQLERDSAIGAADAMTDARIGAKQAQFGRAKDIEGMRLGTEQDISSRLQSNANTLGNQQMSAVKTLGEQNLTNAQHQEGAQMEAATRGGQAATSAIANAGDRSLATGQATQATGQKLATQADQASSERAAAVAKDRQATTQGVQDTAYKQGMQTTQATSQGAQAVGDARRQGEQASINARAGQQAAAQQGATTARSQQIQNQSVTNSGTQSAASAAGSYKVGKANTPGTLEKIGGLAIGAASAFADGGIAGLDGPEIATVGEAGPEAIIPLDPGSQYAQNEKQPGYMDRLRSRYRANSSSNDGNVWQGMGKLAGSAISAMADGGIVTKPTVALLGESGPEAVVPMGGHKPNQKVSSNIAMKSRYRHPTGPSGPHGPIRSLTPLAPNRLYR